MTNKVEIKHTYNPAYVSDDYDDHKYSHVEILLNGKSVFRQGASESLSECPEDAYFHRDLNDPLDVVGLVKKLLKDDSDYEVTLSSEEEEW